MIPLNNLHIFIPPHQFERRKKIKNKLFSIYRFICFEMSRFGENFTDEMSQMNKIYFVSSSARFLIGNSCRSIRRLKKNSNELFNFIIKERNATLWWKFIHHSINQHFIPSSSSMALFIAEYIKKRRKKERNALILLLKEGTSRFNKNLYIESLKNLCAKEKSVHFVKVLNQNLSFFLIDIFLRCIHFHESPFGNLRRRGFARESLPLLSVFYPNCFWISNFQVEPSHNPPHFAKEK